MEFDIKKIEHDINNRDNIILEPSKKYKNHICVTNDTLNGLAYDVIPKKIDSVVSIPYKKGNKWVNKEMDITKDIVMLPINLCLDYGKAFYNQKDKVLELHIDVNFIKRVYTRFEEDIDNNKLNYLIKKEIIKSVEEVKEVLEFMYKHYKY